VKRISRFAALLVMLTASVMCFGQETTGGLQGVVKDPSGALVPKAKVVLSGTSLVGTKELTTDSSGYYRFANLPPGTYTVTVTAPGFSTYKHENLLIEIGHAPTENATLGLGAATTTVEVSTAAPQIDVTSVENMTNVTKDVLDNVPRGVTYQSVIEFAPMARNEPLAGSAGGTGGSMPGSSGNGLSYGYSIGGAADSENSYLIEGQDTEDISAGYSKANVPMEFIQEVQVKTSGISAEYGGALGGVVNVVMKKGSNAWHGQLYGSYQSDRTSANPNNPLLQYNPLASAGAFTDVPSLYYSQQKEHYLDVQPGVTVGGPIMKDRIWFFAGLEPYFNTVAKTVDFALSGDGNQYFTQDKQTYFGTMRIDAAVTSKIRVFASWLDQYARETGDIMPYNDPINAESSYLNPSTAQPLVEFSHGHGFAAPNATYNFGADWSITPHLVSTSRYGYFFQNYHDFGWSTTGSNLNWEANSQGECQNLPGGAAPTGTCTDQTTQGLPTALQQVGGYSTTAYDSTFTQFNASKHYQLNEDLAFYKSGKAGTHNLKFGYELNHLSNLISQNGNVPEVDIVAGADYGGYTSNTTYGAGTCTTLGNYYGGVCAGAYGYAEVVDFATVLNTPASDYNHAFYIQDSWTVGKGLTLDIGLRVEKEDLPAPNGTNVAAIHFGWGDKIEPRVGAAWDPLRNGKMKFFGSYGVTNDVMKLLLAQTSFGAQAYEVCAYPLGPDSANDFAVSDINTVFKAGRACPSGPTNTQANFTTSGPPPTFTDSPTGVSLIENVNFRPAEPVVSGVKPYRQHEYVGGWDYQVSRDWSFEARYDRRRLDHILEDGSLSDRIWGETYTIINPGEGPNKDVDTYAAYLKSLGQDYLVPGWAFSDTTDYGAGANFDQYGLCGACTNPKAVRNYDGLELRFTKAMSNHWSAMASWTYASLWGNYTGLTTTDQSDGGAGGRASPNTTRAFDEPFYYFGANGKNNNGPLPTDRPNTFKGYSYYQLPWAKHQVTTFGLFQDFYQGSPVGSYTDVASSEVGGVLDAVYMYGRGQWVNVSQNPTTGAVTIGNPSLRRTPWYLQTDFNVSHAVRISDAKAISFEATALNLWNQHAITSYYEGMDSIESPVAVKPTNPYLPTPGPVSLSQGASTYKTLEGGYNPTALINATETTSTPYIVSSQYGKPNLFQNGRTIRLAVRFTF